jgi:hypothetical protein
MGVFRGGLLVIFSILFLLCLIIQGFFLTVYFSLDYNAVNPQISSVALGLLEKQGVLSQVNSSLIQEQVSRMVEEKYYGNYDCNFFDCIKKTNDPFSLVSKHAQEYWKSKFFFFLIVLLVLAVIIFLLVEHKSSFFLLSSALFAISSLPFLKLDVLAEFILKPFFSVSEKIGDLSFSSFLDLFSVFLVKSPVVFVWFLGIAISLFIIWIIIELFKVGFEISVLVTKFSGWFRKSETSIAVKQDKQPIAQVQSSKKIAKKPASKKKSK